MWLIALRQDESVRFTVRGDPHEHPSGRRSPQLPGRHHRRSHRLPRAGRAARGPSSSATLPTSHPSARPSSAALPVCNDEFSKRNVKTIARLGRLPRGPPQGWAPDIEDVGGVPLNFPIIADPDRAVSMTYDMIHPGEGATDTVRSVFIIDPNNKVRLTLTYPKSVGRNFDEIIRVIDALAAHRLGPGLDSGRLDARPAHCRLSGDVDRGRQGAVHRRRRGQALPPLRGCAVDATSTSKGSAPMVSGLSRMIGPVQSRE